MLGSNHDLKAPDYSYMMIAKLKDFYYQKFTLFEACKEKTIELLQLVQNCCQQFKDGATTIYNTVQTIPPAKVGNKYKDLSHFASHLHRAANHAYMNYDILDGHMKLINKQPGHPINLDGFKTIPPFDQVYYPNIQNNVVAAYTSICVLTVSHPDNSYMH